MSVEGSPISAITTHVLDTARGAPAAAVGVVLEQRRDDAWIHVGGGTTDVDGRLRDLLPPERAPQAGVYRLTFDTGAYLRTSGAGGFYPEVTVVFEISDPSEHHHVPLLLSPYGYATYRGS
jgi:5-hydroxyisourate hydrolase